MENCEIAQSYEPFSVTTLFEDSCPFFMSLGMSYDDFWNGDCELTRYNLRAHKIKQDRLNSEMYWQGYYTFYATHRAVLKAFAKNESEAAQVNYLDRPLPRTVEEVEELKRQDEIERQQQMKAYFANRFKK